MQLAITASAPSRQESEGFRPRHRLLVMLSTSILKLVGYEHSCIRPPFPTACFGIPRTSPELAYLGYPPGWRCSFFHIVRAGWPSPRIVHSCGSARQSLGETRCFLYWIRGYSKRSYTIGRALGGAHPRVSRTSDPSADSLLALNRRLKSWRLRSIH